jgi:hypothetical protein
MKYSYIKTVVNDGSITIDTKTTKNPNDFAFSAFIDDKSKVIMSGLQANHSDPEWPELHKALCDCAEALHKVHKLCKPSNIPNKND